MMRARYEDYTGVDSVRAGLTTTRSTGRRYPELTIARSTLCVLSRTAASAKPTSTVLGADENDTSTSTSTGVASIPTRVYDASFESIGKNVRGKSAIARDGRTPPCRQSTRLTVDMSLPCDSGVFIHRPRNILVDDASG